MSAPIKNYLSIDALERPGFLSHLVLWCTILVVFVAIVWANFAELDEITRAEGRVIPSSQIQVIQNLEGGILREVLVKEGDQVAKGQVLLQIDDTRFTSSLNESQSKVTALRFRILRLESEISMQPMIEPPDLSPSEQQTFDDEAKLYQSRQEELSSSLSILKQQLNQHRQTKRNSSVSCKTRTSSGLRKTRARNDGASGRDGRSLPGRIATAESCSERSARPT